MPPTADEPIRHEGEQSAAAPRYGAGKHDTAAGDKAGTDHAPPRVNRLQWNGPFQFGVGTMLVSSSLLAVLFGLYAALLRGNTANDDPFWSLGVIALTIALPMAVMIGLSFVAAVRRIARGSRAQRTREP